MELVNELGELRDPALKCAETWQRLYEEEVAKRKPLTLPPELEERLALMARGRFTSIQTNAAERVECQPRRNRVAGQ